MVMSPRGNFEGMDLGKSNPMSSLFSGQPSGFLGAYSFPAAPVQVGDAWTTHTKMAMLGADLTNTYSLTKAWVQDGKQFVSLHSNSSGTLSMKPNAKLAMSMSGPIDSTSDITMDVTSGIIRQVKGSANIKMTMTMTMPASQGAQPTPQTVVNDSTMSTAMQLVRVDQH